MLGVVWGEGRAPLTSCCLVLEVSEIDDPNAFLVLVEREIESQAPHNPDYRSTHTSSVTLMRTYSRDRADVCSGEKLHRQNLLTSIRRLERVEADDQHVLERGDRVLRVVALDGPHAAALHRLPVHPVLVLLCEELVLEGMGNGRRAR
jgi:hypothetical protein